FLIGIAAYVLKRKHSDGSLVRHRKNWRVSALRRRRASSVSRPDPIHPDEPRYVLEVVFTQVIASNTKPVAPLVPNPPAATAATGRLDDARRVLGDFQVNEFAAMRSETRQRPRFVLAHQAAVSGDISSEDGREPPFHPLFGQPHTPAAIRRDCRTHIGRTRPL